MRSASKRLYLRIIIIMIIIIIIIKEIIKITY